MSLVEPCIDFDDIEIEHRINKVILERNSLVLPDTTKLNSDFNRITNDLLYSYGMVRFEYRDWHNVTRRIEGHVCLVQCNDGIGKDVKIWTEKNEMLNVYFSGTWEITVLELPSDYSTNKENLNDL